MPHRLNFLPVLILFALVCAGCAVRGPVPAPSAPDKTAARALAVPGPDVLARDLAKTIEAAGKNAPRIRAFVESYPPGTQARQAANFLAAYLPLSDAATITTSQLKEHVDLALAARKRFPWTRDMPWNLFLRFVLPHRMSQEPVQDWRRGFWNELGPSADSAPDARHAAMMVNRWCAERAAFVSTNRRDQGPLTTLALGRGRCEEMAVLFTAAARSVGLAVRPAMVPRWQHGDDNHLWVEVFDGQDWFFLEAGSVRSSPDTAWFAAQLHRAPLVTATVYGAPSGPPVPTTSVPTTPDPTTPDPTAPDSDTRRISALLMNRSRDYAAPGRLKVEVRNGHGPVDGTKIYLSVWNYGGFKPVAALRADASGRKEMTVIQGTFLITARIGERMAAAFATVPPGGRAGAVLDMDATLPVIMEQAMDFTTDQPLFDRLQAEQATRENDFAPLTERLEQVRAARLVPWRYMAAATVGATGPGHPALKTSLGRALLRSGTNVLAPALALAAADQELRPVLGGLIAVMDAKDLAQCTAQGLLDDAGAAIKARRALAVAGLAAYDDETFMAHVLPGRIKHEPFSHWRTALNRQFAYCLQGAATIKDVAQRVNKAVAALPAMGPERLGPGLTPLAALLAGRVVRNADRSGLAGAILRSLGVPVRALVDHDRLEFLDHETWRPLYPDEPDRLGEAAEPGGRIRLALVRGGQAVGPDKARYGRDFALARMKDKGYAAMLLTPDLEWDEAAREFVFTLEPGRYWLTWGSRGPDGRVLARLRRVLMRPGETVSQSGSLAPPPPRH